MIVLDEPIARLAKLIGYDETEKCWIVHDYVSPYYRRKSNFQPFVKLEDAFEVADKIQDKRVMNFTLGREYCLSDMPWKAVFTDLDGQRFVGVDLEAPKAICIAALKVCGVEVEI